MRMQIHSLITIALIAFACGGHAPTPSRPAAASAPPAVAADASPAMAAGPDGRLELAPGATAADLFEAIRARGRAAGARDACMLIVDSPVPLRATLTIAVGDKEVAVGIACDDNESIAPVIEGRAAMLRLWYGDLADDRMPTHGFVRLYGPRRGLILNPLEAVTGLGSPAMDVLTGLSRASGEGKENGPITIGVPLDPLAAAEQEPHDDGDPPADQAAAGTTAGAAASPECKTGEALRPADVAAVLDSRKQDLALKCFASPPTRGGITLLWNILPDGAVANARVEFSSVDESGAADCLVGVIRSLRFPAGRTCSPAEVGLPLLYSQP